MQNLFEAATADHVKDRISRLRPDSERVWGSMTAPQALAHCSVAMEWALGDSHPPRMFVGRILGPLVKGRAINSVEPLKRNTPTAKALIVQDQRDLSAEQKRLSTLIDRFASAGPQGCTTHPHSFFGPLTPEEWARLMYKHLDHHLRQFGV
jgi:hypothetical protein